MGVPTEGPDREAGGREGGEDRERYEKGREGGEDRERYERGIEEGHSIYLDAFPCVFCAANIPRTIGSFTT